MGMNKKAKVCIMSTGHYALDHRIYYKQARTLASAGNEVVIIAQYDGKPTVDGIRISALTKPGNRLRRMLLLNLIVFLRALQEKADVYHFHDPEMLPVGFLIKMITRRKVIYDVHEDYAAVMRTKPWILPVFRPVLSVGFDRFERLLAQFFDTIVVATEPIGERFRGQRTVVIRNYPVLSSVSEASCLVAAEKTPGVENRILVYAGGLTESRGILELVKAMELLDDKWRARLQLIGDFKDKTFQEQIMRQAGFSKVDLIGVIPHDRVNCYLCDADIGLVCIHPEERYRVALPVKLFEYMAAGLPVIASDFPRWREIAAGNSCGLMVDPLDPQQIANAIHCLLSDEDLRRKLGQNSSRAVLTQFNWEAEGARLLAMYRELQYR